jgi:hypothetical protein
VQATAETAILYPDRPRLQLLLHLRAMWYRIGQQA